MADDTKNKTEDCTRQDLRALQEALSRDYCSLYKMVMSIDKERRAAQDRLTKLLKHPELWQIYDEEAEEYLGLALVACQIFINGVAQAFIKIWSIMRQPEKALTRKDVLMMGSSGGNIRVIHELANYFKHRDEWPDWDKLNGQQKRTLKVIEQAGIKNSGQSDDLSRAIRKLYPGAKDLGIEGLLEEVDNWQRELKNQVDPWLTKKFEDC